MRPSTARFACGLRKHERGGDAQPFHREDVTRAAPLRRLSCRTTRASLEVKQKKSTSRASGSIHIWTSSSSSYRITACWRVASNSRAKVRTDKLQPVIDAARVLRTLMKDARGGLIR
jgi:hypothetical protein